MEDYMDNIKLSDLPNYENKKYDYNKIYSFINKNTTLSNEEIIYIINLVFTKLNTNILHDLIDEEILNYLYDYYLKNAMLMKKHYDSIKIIVKKELLYYLNNNNSYCLFENINLSNIDYYSVIWETIFN